MPEQIENRMVVDSELDEIIDTTPHVRCDCGRAFPATEQHWFINGSIYCKECVNEAIEDFLFEHRKVVM